MGALAAVAVAGGLAGCDGDGESVHGDRTMPWTLFGCDTGSEATDCLSFEIWEHFPSGKKAIVGVWCDPAVDAPVTATQTTTGGRWTCTDRAWGIEAALTLDLHTSEPVGRFDLDLPSGKVVGRAVPKGEDWVAERSEDGRLVGHFRVMPTGAESSAWAEIRGDFRVGVETAR